MSGSYAFMMPFGLQENTVIAPSSGLEGGARVCREAVRCSGLALRSQERAQEWVEESRVSSFCRGTKPELVQRWALRKAGGGWGVSPSSM